MNLPAIPFAPVGLELLSRLGHIANKNGLDNLAKRLRELGTWIGTDLCEFERELAALGHGYSLIERVGRHLLDLDGKHLRPMCVFLGAKLGAADAITKNLALAVELVHSATLLHDDVVDSGTTRRGSPTARSLYGNAASIFAGDWLLVQALTRIRQTANLELLDKMLAVIDEMILAESVQLENRGQINADRDDYFAVVEGKTASLFRWAMYAGGTAGGLSPRECSALECFGLHLGVAFQAVDDLLDLDGNVATTGKALYADLREGKLSYPLLVALEREPAFKTTLMSCIEASDDLSPVQVRSVLAAMKRTRAIRACRNLAEDRAGQAIAALDAIGDGPGKNALITLANAAIHRNR